MPEIHTSLGFSRFPRRERDDCTMQTAACSMSRRARGSKLRPARWSAFPRGSRSFRRSIALLQSCRFCSLKLSVSPTVPAADESCTCCARREQAQDPYPLLPLSSSFSSLPPSLLFALSFFPRWLSFSVSLSDKPSWPSVEV